MPGCFTRQTAFRCLAGNFLRPKDRGKKGERKNAASIQLTRNNFVTGAAANHFYPDATSTERGTPTGGGERELERRLKLDLLISAGNVAVTVPDPSHTLLNLHFVIPTLPFVIAVISSRLFSARVFLAPRHRRNRARYFAIPSLSRIHAVVLETRVTVVFLWKKFKVRVWKFSLYN